MNRVNAILISTGLASLDRDRTPVPEGQPIPENLVTTIYKKMSVIGFDKINNDYSVEEVNELVDELLASFKKDGQFARVTEFAKLQEIETDGEKDLVFFNTFDLMGDGVHELNIVIGQNDPKGPLDFRVQAVRLENPGTDHENVLVHHETRIVNDKVVYRVWPELPVVEEGEPIPEIIKQARETGQLAASMLKPLIMDCANLMSEIDTNTAAVTYAARDAMMKL